MAAADHAAAEQPLQVQLLSCHAKLPVRATAGAAGYDLFSAQETTIISQESRALFSLDIVLSLPPGTYGRIAPRSGLALKEVDVAAGVIDPDFRGPVCVLLVNHGTVPFRVERGMRIAQLILERCETPPVQEVKTLTETARGAQGFGSTGQFALPVEPPSDVSELSIFLTSFCLLLWFIVLGNWFLQPAVGYRGL